MSVAHYCLNIFDSSRDSGRQILASIFSNQAVILNSEADTPLLVIDSYIYAENHARSDKLRRLNHVMHVEPDVMGPASPVGRPVALRKL